MHFSHVWIIIRFGWWNERDPASVWYTEGVKIVFFYGSSCSSAVCWPETRKLSSKWDFFCWFLFVHKLHILWHRCFSVFCLFVLKVYYLSSCTLGLFTNIRSFKNYNTFFLPTKQLHHTRRGSIFRLLKTHLNPRCQAGDTRRGVKSGGEAAEVKQLPVSLPGSGSRRNSLRSQAALTYTPLAGKIGIIHAKQRPFILWFPLCIPGCLSCSYLAFSESRVQPRPLRN